MMEKEIEDMKCLCNQEKLHCYFCQKKTDPVSVCLSKSTMKTSKQYVKSGQNEQ